MNSQRRCVSWLPPGGSCHDEISASRNRYFVVTDEGRRQLKVLYFSVEWYNLEHIPLIQLHSLTNRSPPLISQPVPKCRLTASPGGSQAVQTFSLYALLQGACRSSGCFLKSGVTGGFYPPLQGVVQNRGVCHTENLTVSERYRHRAGQGTAVSIQAPWQH